MKFGSGALLVAAGLLVLWLAVSGKLSNLSAAWGALNGVTPDTTTASNAQPVPNMFAGFPAEAFPRMTIPAPTPIAG